MVNLYENLTILLYYDYYAKGPSKKMKKILHMWYNVIILKNLPEISMITPHMQTHEFTDPCPSDYINKIRYDELFSIFYKAVDLMPMQFEDKNGVVKVANLFDITDFSDVLDEITKIISYELDNWDHYDDINKLFKESNNYIYRLVCMRNKQLQHVHLTDNCNVGNDEDEYEDENEY